MIILLVSLSYYFFNGNNKKCLLYRTGENVNLYFKLISFRYTGY